MAGVDWQALLFTGTVLREGEDPASARVVDAAGHGVAIAYQPAGDIPAELEAFAAAVRG